MEHLRKFFVSLLFFLRYLSIIWKAWSETSGKKIDTFDD